MVRHLRRIWVWPEYAEILKIESSKRGQSISKFTEIQANRIKQNEKLKKKLFGDFDEWFK